MGILNWLNPRTWFQRSTPAPDETVATSDPAAQPSAAVSTAPTTPAAATAPEPSRTTNSAKTGPRQPAPSDERCQATTAQGTQCKSSSRDNSKYCGRHKGYRASPASTGKASSATGRSAAKSARTTKTATRSTKTAKRATKATSSGTGNGSQVRHGAYRLYQKGNRYYFSKKTQTEAKADGAKPVSSMPPGRHVVETPNGLPVLKKA